MPQLTVSQCEQHILHTLGGATKPPAVGTMRILNDAGEYLCSAYPWAWLEGKRATLDFESGQDHAWLPADFQELTAIETTSGVTSNVKATTTQHLVDLRTKNIGTTALVYWYAIIHAKKAERATGTITFTGVPADDAMITIDDGINPPITFTLDVGGTGDTGTGGVVVDISDSGETTTTVAAALQDAINAELESGDLEIRATASGAVVTLTNRHPGTQGNVTMTATGTTNATLAGMSGGLDGGDPRAQLALWPDPGADDDEALTIHYRGGWETLDEDAHFVSIPVWMQPLYLQVVRAFARGYEWEDGGSVSARCGEVMAGPLMAACTRRDGAMQADHGELMHGAVEGAMGFGTYHDFEPVADPS